MGQVHRRLRIEIALGVLSAVLFLLTLVTREWIELVFRVDPDHGDGSFEWLIFAATATVALGAALLARADWRRLHAAAQGTAR
jgi:hypothetical protein